MNPIGKRTQETKGRSWRLIAAGILLLAVVLPVLWFGFGQWTNPATTVILITVDTLRADHLGIYGYARQTSPNVDAFARESLLFRLNVAQSSETNPSLASLMTSYYPHETTVMRNLHKVPDQLLTLAEILRKAGYQTGAVVSNFSLRKGSGFEQGFDTYDDTMEDVTHFKWEGIERVGLKTTGAALDWLKQHVDGPKFLWVHYMDPHYPYAAPAPYTTMFLTASAGEDRWVPFNSKRTGNGGIDPGAQLGDHHEYQYYVSQYDSEIRYFDDCFQRLLEGVRKLGLLDNSLIVLAGDHGEGMGEYDYYFAHAEHLYRGLIHVPLLVRFPDKRLAGEERTYQVANTDILPTILDELHIPRPDSIRGRHLLSAEKRDILSESLYAGAKRSLLVDGAQLIDDDGQLELYRWESGADRRVELGTGVDTMLLRTVGQLKQQLDEVYHDDRLGLGAPVEWRIDMEEERKLRALGYIQ